MSRMHSSGRGKSRSTKPSDPKKPTWLAQSPKEIELLIAKYAKEGRSSSQIGLALRDEYGIPSIKLLTGKTLSQILKDKGVQTEIPEDLMALITKAVLVKKHLDVNKGDMTAKRGLQLTESKIKRLADYYKGTGRLSAEWKYDPERIKLYVE